MTIDTTGSLYLADSGQGSICKLLPTGEIQRLASGLSLSASIAQDAVPITVNRRGRIFFAERFNPVLPRGVVLPPDRIQSLSPDGTIENVLNLSATAFAISPSDNLVYAAGPAIFQLNDNGSTTLLAGGRSGLSGDGGAATMAAFSSISGLAFDPTGTLYIADSGNRRVRRLSQGVVTTFATMSEPPTALMVQSEGVVYVRVGGRVYLLSGSQPRLVAGGGAADIDGGSARAIRFGIGGGLAVSATGDLLISEQSGLRRLLPSPTADENCLYSINASPTRQFASGGTVIVDVVVSQQACSWALGNIHSWVTPAETRVRTGNGSVIATISPNDSAEGRVAKIWAAGASINVAQDGVACRYFVEDSKYSFGGPGGDGQIKVTAVPGDCAWSISTTERWIFVGPTSAGRGDGVVKFTVGPNSGPLRAGTISVNGTSIKVTQGSSADALPLITSDGVVNAATLVSGPISNGEVVTIFGSALGPSVGRRSELLVSELAGTIVTVNDVPGYIVYANQHQVNVLVPSAAFKTGTRDLKILVEREGLISNAVKIPIAAASPGIYTLNGSGTGPAVTLNGEGELISSSNPAHRGDVIAMFLTGAGSAEPAIEDGAQPQGPSFPNPVLRTSVRIGGRDAELLFVGMVYNGVLQINAIVPQTVEVGQVEVIATIGSARSRAGVTIALR